MANSASLFFLESFSTWVGFYLTICAWAGPLSSFEWSNSSSLATSILKPLDSYWTFCAMTFYSGMTCLASLAYSFLASSFYLFSI